MGTYYRIDNHAKQECIDLCYISSIKRGAFQSWSLQHAVLNVFLGFDSPDFNCGKEWVGRWELNPIRIHSDYEDDSACDSWPDAGMQFIEYLYDKGVLQDFLRAFDFIDRYERVVAGILTSRR